MTTAITPLSNLSPTQARQRMVWGLGDYPGIADTVIPDLGATLVSALGIRAGEDVLDVAAGAGNASLPAARAAAQVTATDLNEDLLSECANRARRAGVALTCRAGDAEDLPFEDGSFDVVMSCVGAMFAPDHGAVGRELRRVCRPGGRLGLLSWTADGFVGRLLAALRPFVPPPPAGAEPPTRWGDPAYVRSLLGLGAGDVDAHLGLVQVDCFASPEGFRELFKASYGPIVAVYQAISGEPGRVRDLDAVLDQLAADSMSAGSMSWEYLLVVARVETKTMTEPRFTRCPTDVPSTSDAGPAGRRADVPC